jgi:hypothetical protein
LKFDRLKFGFPPAPLDFWGKDIIHPAAQHHACPAAADFLRSGQCETEFRQPFIERPITRLNGKRRRRPVNNRKRKRQISMRKTQVMVLPRSPEAPCALILQTCDAIGQTDTFRKDAVDDWIECNPRAASQSAGKVSMGRACSSSLRTVILP